jgi:Leucine-rich repeat (LRR) protein
LKLHQNTQMSNNNNNIEASQSDIQDADESDTKEQEQEQEIELAIKNHFFKNEYKFLTEIPAHLFESRQLKTELEVLYLSNNRITGFPYEIFQFENLKVVNMSHNRVSNLTEEFMMLTKLIAVDFSHNLLIKLPDRWLRKLHELQLLILDYNHIKHLPPSLWSCTSLTHLQFSGNQLTSIPNEIAFLKNLKILHLKHNRLKSLPEDFCKLTGLEELHLERNLLTSLPEKFMSSLTSLKHFNISHNYLKDASLNNLAQIKDLTAFHFGSNRLSTLPDLNLDMEHLHTVDLSNNRFSRFPISLASAAEYIVELDLRNNKLASLPIMQVFVNLKYLNVCYNKLTSLPKELGYCRNLKILRASHNEIQMIHSHCFNASMMKLVELHLDFNKLTTLPNTVHLLPELMEINVEHNCLTEFPSNLYQSRLYGILARNNKIKQLPDHVGKFKRLRKLYLQHNEIISVPKSIRRCTTLSFFNLCDNPIVDKAKAEGLDAVIENDEDSSNEPATQQTATEPVVQKDTESPEEEKVHEDRTILTRIKSVGKDTFYRLLPGADATQQESASPGLTSPLTSPRSGTPTATANNDPFPEEESEEEEERTIEMILALPPREHVVCCIQ